ncbi:MAG: hypothetical protein ACP5PW_08410 [Candidatus Dormibacteria bacterium]
MALLRPGVVAEPNRWQQLAADHPLLELQSGTRAPARIWLGPSEAPGPADFADDRADPAIELDATGPLGYTPKSALGTSLVFGRLWA